MTDDSTARQAVARAIALDGDPDTVRAFYDDWAARYDVEVGGEVYAAPRVCVGLLAEEAAVDERLAPESDPQILDAGCGTGLVGVELSGAGYCAIDGFDLSPGMVDQARARGVYRHLWPNVDLTRPLELDGAGPWDVVVSAGVFTPGHVPPAALVNLVERTRSGGLLIVSTRHTYVAETDFVPLVEGLVEQGRVELLRHLDDAPYSVDASAQYWALLVS